VCIFLSLEAAGGEVLYDPLEGTETREKHQKITDREDILR
jgi:hypothetical protein